MVPGNFTRRRVGSFLTKEEGFTHIKRVGVGTQVEGREGSEREGVGRSPKL